MMAKRRSIKKKQKNRKRFFPILLKVVFYFIIISAGWVILYRFVNPPITVLMIQRNSQDIPNDKQPVPRKWVNYEDLSENLKRAVIASEDAHFMQHRGFDKKAIEEAIQKNKEGAKLRGGSTISQQTAKNVFLWPQRSWVRKGLEAWFTILIEAFWSKERILEVYLNVIEMGPNLYGAESATQYYFNKSAQSLTKRQAALIAAVLPNPLRWSPAKPTNYISNRAYRIVRYMPHSEIP